MTYVCPNCKKNESITEINVCEVEIDGVLNDQGYVDAGDDPKARIGDNVDSFDPRWHCNSCGTNFEEPLEMELTQEQVVHAVWSQLLRFGYSVAVEYPPLCISVTNEDGSEWWFGTANYNWGASLILKDGMDGNRELKTDCPSNCVEVDRITDAIMWAVAVI